MFTNANGASVFAINYMKQSGHGSIPNVQWRTVKDIKNESGFTSLIFELLTKIIKFKKSKVILHL